MTRLFDTKNPYSDFFLSNNRVINQEDIKKVTKSLCLSYKRGTISEEVFHNIIETLLMNFIERSFEDKLSSKVNKIDDKLFKHSILAKW